jgi:hypothetical protein
MPAEKSTIQLPDFVVIGAQKGGSTYLLECLRDHPAIFMPPEEIPFCELGSMTTEQRTAFARHFAGARPEQRVGVKRPNLLGNRHSAKWLAEFLPEAKIIAILRDPIERAVSGYFHYMATGLLPVLPIEEGLPMILDQQIDPNEFPRAREVLEFGLYARQLDLFDKYFPAGQSLVVLIDEVKNDAKSVLSRLYEFLGVDPNYRPRTIARRPMQSPYSLQRLKIRKWLYEPTRERPLGASYFKVKRTPIAYAYRAFVRIFDQYLLKQLFPAKPPKLSSVVRQRLIDYYRDDVAALSQRMEVSLDHWLPSKETPR